MELIQAPFGWHQGLHMGMHWLWWLFWILVAAAVVWAAWRVVRGGTGGDRGPTRREAPEEVLRRRFSQGEITEDEFRRRLRVLRESRSPGRDAEAGD